MDIATAGNSLLDMDRLRCRNCARDCKYWPASGCTLLMSFNVSRQFSQAALSAFSSTCDFSKGVHSVSISIIALVMRSDRRG